MSRNADFFDQWYAEMGRSASRDQIVRRALGLPSDMDASGLLPWSAVTEVAAALNLASRQLLVDLGCGRGGYSLEMARQTGARLLGLDFSPVAIIGAGPAWPRLPPTVRQATPGSLRERYGFSRQVGGSTGRDGGAGRG